MIVIFSIIFQAFHVLYHLDNNVLLGAPTGSGKTISAELAMLHLFDTQPDMKVHYIPIADKNSNILYVPSLWSGLMEP